MVRTRLRAGLTNSYKLRFLFVLCSIFVLTGIVGGYIYVSVDERLEQEIQQELVANAENEGQQLGTWLSLTNQQLTSVVRTSAVRSGDRFRTADQLSKLTQRNAIAGVHLVDLDSSAVDISSGRDDGLDESGRLTAAAWERVEAAIADGNAGSVVYTEPFAVENDKPVLLAVTQTADTNQAVVSVIDLRRLSSLMYGAGYGSGSQRTASVSDSDGTVILSSDPSAILSRDPVRETADLTATGFGTYDTDGGIAAGHTTLDRHSWTVTTTLPTTEAYSLRDSVRNGIVLLLGLLFVGLAGLGATIGRDTIRTIGKLAEEAETLRTGGIDEPVETERSDEFGTVFESLESLRQSLAAEIQAVEAEKAAAETARAEASEARADAERLNDHLQSKAADFGSTMNRAASGDLTQRLDPESESDAMSEIAHEFNRMLERIEATVASVSAFAADVSSGSAQVRETTASVETSSERVTTAINQISHETAQQHDSFRTANDQLGQLSGAIQEVAAASDTVADTATRTAEASRQGQHSARDAIEGMEQTKATAAEAEAAMNDLSAEVDRIDELIERITEIARQTNLLALNASIEAARSDQSADGFTVVADEIMMLSDEVKETVTDVETRLETIQELTDDSTAAVARTDQQLHQVSQDVTDAGAALRRIASAAEETNQGIQDISTTTEQQAASTTEIVGMVEDVTTVSEQIATEADSVATAADEQQHSIETVVSSVESLSEQARTLSETMDQFTTAVDVHPDEMADTESPPESAVPAGSGTLDGDLPSTESLGELAESASD